MSYRLVTTANSVNNMNRDQKMKELQGGIIISNLLQHLRSRVHLTAYSGGCMDPALEIKNTKNHSLEPFLLLVS